MWPYTTDAQSMYHTSDAFQLSFVWIVAWIVDFDPLLRNNVTGSGPQRVNGKKWYCKKLCVVIKSRKVLYKYRPFTIILQVETV